MSEDKKENFTSPTMVLAGPGAGKTYLLAKKIKLLLDKDVDKNTITVITFGVEASQHMRDELTNLDGDFRVENKDLPCISTMHSLGFEIVKEKPFDVKLRKTNLEVQGNEDVKKLMYRDAAYILGLTETDGQQALKCKQYGDCKENLKDKKCRICHKYWDIMSKCNYIDFDDQILFACKILENNQTILEKYHNRAKYLLVDEYQDINAAQFRFIELLSRASRKGLLVVGDDAQSIYSFRGCSPEFILRFEKDFPGAVTPPLTQSRRCHEKTMDDAFKVLTKYYSWWQGIPKLIYLQKEGDEPAIWQLPSGVSEALMVARLARHFLNEKKEVLILAPKKEFFPLISKKLYEHNVPHECPVSLLPEQVNKRLQVLKLFMKWISNLRNSFITRLVFEELINDGIAKVPGAKKDKKCKPETIEMRIKAETKIAELWESVDKGKDLYSAVLESKSSNITIKTIQNALSNLINLYNNYQKQDEGEFLKQISLVTGKWTTPTEFAKDVIAIKELLDLQSPTGIGYVQMKTMRKAKGLQADIVIIVGLEDDIMPNPRGDEEEEARLLYVSITRAKERAYLFHAYKRLRNISYGPEFQDKPRSRFLDAIGRDSEYIKPKL